MTKYIIYYKQIIGRSVTIEADNSELAISQANQKLHIDGFSDFDYCDDLDSEDVFKVEIIK